MIMPHLSIEPIAFPDFFKVAFARFNLRCNKPPSCASVFKLFYSSVYSYIRVVLATKDPAELLFNYGLNLGYTKIGFYLVLREQDHICSRFKKELGFVPHPNVLTLCVKARIRPEYGKLIISRGNTRSEALSALVVSLSSPIEKERH